MLAALAESVLQAVIAKVPVGRLGRPEEVARSVRFLIDEGSGYITASRLRPYLVEALERGIRRTLNGS